ncbi:hypothetical protein CARUB_v10009968mg [Capsella rubella]|uniref:DUF1639 domain-containing protein n=1 Tax=Capsella rubella TaxID=81985 RepID=R0IJ95_9BRAS|nr:uncharacterized protein LOC17900181 [Capsella rubella]EOA36988.1 hypothetical protein CARUB_v10009968mg [Capsella rubella]
MVFPGETTTTRPEQRSKSLHNFPLPNLWGNQRHLKCMKIDSITSNNGGVSGGDHRLRRRSPPLKYSDSSVSIPFRFGGSDQRRSRNAAFKSGSEEGIEEFRVKLMSDLKTVRDKITQSMYQKDVIEEEEEEEEEIAGSGSGSGSGSGQEKEISPVKPWNLRKRRAACKEPVSNSLKNQTDKGIAIEEERVVVKPSPSLRGGGGGVVEAETKKVRPKFAMRLTKKEIEEDFIGIFGQRPSRRPKKRARAVQKNLDSLFPGLYLTEVTLDAYKVPEETKR